MIYKNYTDLKNVGTKIPFSTHLFWEHPTYGLILVDSTDQTVLLISTDKAETWNIIDLSDNTNSYKIQAGWLDTNDLWLVMCDNPGDDFEVCFIELDDSNDCNPIGVSAGADNNTVFVYDILKADGNFYVYNKEERAAAKKIAYWDVDTAPFTDKLNYAAVNQDILSPAIVDGIMIYHNYEFDDAGTKKILMVAIPSNAFGAWTSSLVELEDYILPALELRAISFDGDDLLYQVFEQVADGKNYLYTNEISDNGDWVNLGEFNVVLMLDRNTAAGVLEKGFHLTEPKLYQLHSTRHQLHLIASLNISGKHIVGITDNFLILKDD